MISKHCKCCFSALLLSSLPDTPSDQFMPCATGHGQTGNIAFQAASSDLSDGALCLDKCKVTEVACMVALVRGKDFNDPAWLIRRKHDPANGKVKTVHSCKSKGKNQGSSKHLTQHGPSVTTYNEVCQHATWSPNKAYHKITLSNMATQNMVRII